MFPLRTSQTTTLPFWSRVRPPAARNLPSGLKSTALSLEKSAGESRDVCGSAWVRPIHISPVRVPPPDQVAIRAVGVALLRRPQLDDIVVPSVGRPGAHERLAVVGEGHAANPVAMLDRALKVNLA